MELSTIQICYLLYVTGRKVYCKTLW